MFQRYRFATYATVVALLILSGCRTYGGYDTEPKTYQALEASVQSFEEDLKEAEADLQQLEEAAAAADTLQVLVEEYRGHLDEHRSLLEKQRHRIERLSPTGSYRDLHEAYGATVTEKRLIQRKYQQTIRQVRTVVQGSAPSPQSERSLAKRYTVRPIGYPELGGEGRVTMEQALRGL